MRAIEFPGQAGRRYPKIIRACEGQSGLRQETAATPCVEKQSVPKEQRGYGERYRLYGWYGRPVQVP